MTIWHALTWINNVLESLFSSLSPEQKIYLSVVGTLIALTGYGWTIFKTIRDRHKIGGTAPNPMTWFGFAGLTGVGALVQFIAERTKGSGIGALTMGVTAVACVFQAGASVIWKKGGWHRNNFKIEDWCALVAGAICSLIYIFSKQLSVTPFAAATFATVADLLLYIPAIRSSWTFPRGENAFGYSMQSLKNIPAIAALSVYSPETWMYPMMLLFMNSAMIVYFVSRRAFVTVEQEKRSKEEQDRRRAENARRKSQALA